jgi:hypothetical protein
MFQEAPGLPVNPRYTPLRMPILLFSQAVEIQEDIPQGDLGMNIAWV